MLVVDTALDIDEGVLAVVDAALDINGRVLPVVDTTLDIDDRCRSISGETNPLAMPGEFNAHDNVGFMGHSFHQ